LHSLFSINTTNVTTDAGFQQYITTAFGNANQTVQDVVTNAYSSNVTEGSPYNTGVQNAVTPEYKRVAAFNGDFYFQAPRRSMLATVSGTQKVWSYLWERMEQEIPILGAFHESDLYLEFYVPAVLSTTLGLANDYIGIDALVNFVNNHDPNYNATASKNALTPSLLQNLTWPQYTTETPLMFTFDDPTNYSITTDDYRGESIALLNKLQIEFGF
jgi:acetylcholinesterase